VSTASVERVTTARLVLARLQPGDAAELTRLLLHPRVAATLWPRPEAPTEADVLDTLEAKIEHWERHGFGMWLARDRVSGEAVGRGGLQFTYTPGLDEIEAGWAIMPERWGQGLATELAWASIEAAFGALGMRDIVALARPDNRASRRVMEKTRFGFEREVVYAGLPHVLYRRRPDPA
jgi:[ribosomal protein S5]-alanine N-acetyltransferase